MIAKRIAHKTECDHAQTPYQRRKCRAAKLAAARQEMEQQMIKLVKIETNRKNWRGETVTTVHEYTQIEGTVTATNLDPTTLAVAGRVPVYTIDAGGTTVTVANPRGTATDMRGVAVGDRVRILADGECTIADYTASSVDRI